MIHGMRGRSNGTIRSTRTRLSYKLLPRTPAVRQPGRPVWVASIQEDPGEQPLRMTGGMRMDAVAHWENWDATPVVETGPGPGVCPIAARSALVFIHIAESGDLHDPRLRLFGFYLGKGRADRKPGRGWTSDGGLADFFLVTVWSALRKRDGSNLAGGKRGLERGLTVSGLPDSVACSRSRWAALHVKAPRRSGTMISETRC